MVRVLLEAKDGVFRRKWLRTMVDMVELIYSFVEKLSTTGCLQSMCSRSCNYWGMGWAMRIISVFVMKMKLSWNMCNWSLRRSCWGFVWHFKVQNQALKVITVSEEINRLLNRIVVLSKCQSLDHQKIMCKWKFLEVQEKIRSWWMWPLIVNQRKNCHIVGGLRTYEPVSISYQIMYIWLI